MSKFKWSAVINPIGSTSLKWFSVTASHSMLALIHHSFTDGQMWGFCRVTAWGTGTFSPVSAVLRSS